ncbi:MAG TPA: hypothetical protein VFC64_04425, partial [Atopostipes sp.]|nr:hypothetical protein [Atopostipes sp.]
MKKLGSTIFILILFTVVGFAQSHNKTKLGVTANVNSMDIEIQFYGPSIVRVIKSPKGKSFIKESLSVVKTPEDAVF